MGQTESMTLIDEREKWTLDNIKPEEEVAVLTQTTLSVEDTSKAVKQIKRKFPKALVRNDAALVDRANNNTPDVSLSSL